MQHQDQQVQSDLKVRDQLPQPEEECIELFKHIQASLRTTLHPERKSDRLEWDLTQKRESETALTQSQQIQNSLSVPMLSALRQDM